MRLFLERYSKAFIIAVYIAVICLVALYVWNAQVTIRLAHSGGLFRNLMEYPAYVRRGFDLSRICAVPDVQADADAPWYRFASPPLRIMDSPLPDLPKRPFLSPFGRDVQEFTILIALEMDGEAMEALNGELTTDEPDIVMGLFFALIGDNWEIYLNGTLVRSEMHMDGAGRIRSHRSWRDVYFPVDKSLLVPGTNIVALRIVGDPAYICTGLYYIAPYYLDDFRNIEKRNQPFLLLVLCGVFIFTGIYHLMLFFSVKRDWDISHLYLGIFSLLLSAFSIARNGIINALIPDSAVSIRLEYFSIFLAVPLLCFFFESLVWQRITKPSRIYMTVCSILNLSQFFFSLQYGEDLMKVIHSAELFYFSYVVFYNTAYFLRRRRKIGVKPDTAMMARVFFNFFFGVIIVYLCGIFDVIDALFLHYSFNLFQYGFSIFTIAIAFSMVNRFSGLYNRLGEDNLTLEAAVQARTAELRKQTEIAVNASRAKSEFLATMSHEIRTPLNAVIGLSEIELRTDLPPASKNNIEQIHQSGSALLSIINDILDISKIEAGSFELVPEVYDTASFINDTVRLNMVRIGSKPIAFILETGGDLPRKLLGDELRVKQILNNVLSNAIKYTRKGTVTLSAAWEKRGADALLRFTVRDTGLGIRKDDMGKLFTNYTQLDAKTNRKIEGTGLGLAITKNLVEMMGGGITVESEYGKGSAFTVEIIQGIADAEPVGEETAESLRAFRYASSGKNRNIQRSWMPYGAVLVTDDMPVNLQVAQGLLEPYGLRIDTAQSGSGAIEKVRAEDPRYDVIFMDHMMPEMDGIEAVRIIREETGSEYCRNVPIIALTANALTGMKEMFLEKGFNGFISKPVDVAQLDAALNQWVRDKQSAETLRRAEAEAAERRKARQGAASGETAVSGAPPAQSPAAIPGINAERGIALTGGTIGGYRKVLAVFRKDVAERLPRLLKPPEPEALSAFTTQVHALKSASASIGATELSAEAAHLETASKAGDTAFISEHLPGFAERLAALARDIEKALADLAGGAEEKTANHTPAPSALRALMDELAGALETQKADAIDRALEALLAQETDSATREAVEQISDDVLMAEFDTALERVNKLIQEGKEE